jgi:hypothetical protein
MILFSLTMLVIVSRAYQVRQRIQISRFTRERRGILWPANPESIISFPDKLFIPVIVEFIPKIAIAKSACRRTFGLAETGVSGQFHPKDGNI